MWKWSYVCEFSSYLTELEIDYSHASKQPTQRGMNWLEVRGWAEKTCGCILNNLEWYQRENRIIFNSVCTDKLLLIRLAYYLICFLRGEIKCLFVEWGKSTTQATIYSLSQHFVMLPELIYRWNYCFLVQWEKFNDLAVALTYIKRSNQSLNPKVILNREVKSEYSSRKKKLKQEHFHLFVNRIMFYHMFKKLVTYFMIVTQWWTPTFCANWEMIFVTRAMWEGKYLFTMWKEVKSTLSSDCIDPGSLRASLIVQLVKNPPAMQETPVRFLGWEDLLEKG